MMMFVNFFVLSFFITTHLFMLFDRSYYVHRPYLPDNGQGFSASIFE